MPASAATRKLAIQVGYDASQVMQGVPPSKAAVASLGNELRGLKNSFADSGGDARVFQEALRDVRSRAIELADGIDITSREYATLTGVAAQATREIDKQEAALAHTEVAVSRFRTGITDVGAAFEKAQSGFFFFTNNLQTLASVARSAFDQLNQGARKLELRDAFALQIRDSNLSVDQFVAKLDEAASGTINDFDLMSSAARAMSLGVSNDVGVIAELLEIARFKARQFGSDTATAFNDIVTGLGRGSPLILDNLGFTINLTEVNRDYAESLGVSASQLTEVQKKQALLNAILIAGRDEVEASGGVIDSQADKLRQVQVEYDKATTAAQTYFALLAGRSVLASGGDTDANAVENLFRQAATYDALAEASNRARVVLKEQGNATADLAVFQQAFIGNTQGVLAALEGNSAALQAYNRYLIENQAALGLTDVALLNLLNGTQQSQVAFEAQNDIVNRINGTYYENADAAVVTSAETLALEDALIDAKNAALVAAGGFITAGNDALSMAGAFSSAVGFTYDLANALGALNAARAGRSSGDALDVAREQLGFAQNAYANSDSIIGRVNAYANVVEAQNKVADAEENVRNEVARTAEEIKRNAYAAKEAHDRVANAGVRGSGRVASAAKAAATEQKRALKDLEAEAKRTYDNMAGFVDQALSFQGGVGANDDLLDRTGVGRMENRSNEIIRRLEDVRDRALEGNRSQWIESFMGLDNANLEVVAANAERRIRDLQMGIFDSLTPEDREAFKADAMRLMGIQQRAQQFRDELTQELLAAGGNATQVEQAVTALLGAPSESAATGTGADIADALAASLDAKVRADEARYIGIGEFIGMGIKSGTLKGLEGMGVELLAQLRTEINAQIGYAG